MSADPAFLLTLGMRMALTMSLVIAAAFAAERVSPLVAAMVATLPISAGPAYVFLAIDHGPAFVAEGAIASLAINGATSIFCLVYVLLAQSRNTAQSLAGALAVWFVCAFAIRALTPTFPQTLAALAVVLAGCIAITRPYRHAPMPRPTRRWYDLPLRAGMVGSLVLCVVALSPILGPRGSGVLATFPIVLTSLILILHPRAGGRATAAVIANTLSGLIGFGIALATLHVTAVALGSATALLLALTVSIAWNLAIIGARRYGFRV
jgi:hypothetical protein